MSRRRPYLAGGRVLRRSQLTAAAKAGEKIRLGFEPGTTRDGRIIKRPQPKAARRHGGGR
jgi:hypothetical protein